MRNYDNSFYWDSWFFLWHKLIFCSAEFFLKALNPCASFYSPPNLTWIFYYFQGIVRDLLLFPGNSKRYLLLLSIYSEKDSPSRGFETAIIWLWAECSTPRPRRICWKIILNLATYYTHVRARTHSTACACWSQRTPGGSQYSWHRPPVA